MLGTNVKVLFVDYKQRNIREINLVKESSSKEAFNKVLRLNFIKYNSKSTGLKLLNFKKSHLVDLVTMDFGQFFSTRII